MKRTCLWIALLCLTLGASLRAQTTWTLRNQGATPGDYLWSITDGNFGPVAVGDGGKILHSLDGRTWVQRTSDTTGWIVAVTYGNGRYVAVGENGLILTSTNGIAWTPVAITGTTARLNNVLFADNKFVAVGEGGAVVVSLDGGLNWNAATSNAGAMWLHGLAYGAGHWVATGQNGTVITSPNAIDWTRPGAATTQDLEAVVFAESYRSSLPNGTSNYGYFLAIGANATTVVLYFTDFQPVSGNPATSYSSYTTSKPNTTARFRSLTVGNKVYIATGENGSVYSSPSYYGPWSRVAIDTDRNLVGAGFVQGTLMLVGENRTIFQSEQIYVSRLGNVSTRGVAGADTSAMIAGSVIEGPTPKQILIRGIGPGLSQFGVPNVASDPALRVFDSSGRVIATNVGWTNALNFGAIAIATTAVGAFPLTPAAKDCALLLTLTPGAYTFEVSSGSGTIGNALIEAYDIDAINSTTSRTINISTRGQVGTGDNILIAGLVVKGQSSRTLLIRGIGPGLAQFNVPGTLADPVVKVLANDATVLATNDNWEDPTLANGRAVNADEVQTATAASGAFPLASRSKDAALIITLVPGNYTIQVSGANNTTGVALVEAYDVPSR